MPNWTARLVLPLVLALSVIRAEAETWVLASQEKFVPFNYAVDEVYSGIDVDILDEAARRIGVQLEHRPMPWKRVLLDFEAGRVDGMFQLAPTPERFEKWHLVGPMRRTRTVFVTRAGAPIEDIRDLSDLDGLVVGVVAGFTYEEGFDTDAGLVKEESIDDFSNMRKLLLGRVDVIVGGQATLAFVARELRAETKIEVLPTPLVEHARYVGFLRTPEGNAKAARLQQVLDEMHASGRIAQIVQSHLN